MESEKAAGRYGAVLDGNICTIFLLLSCDPSGDYAAPGTDRAPDSEVGNSCLKRAIDPTSALEFFTIHELADFICALQHIKKRRNLFCVEMISHGSRPSKIPPAAR